MKGSEDLRVICPTWVHPGPFMLGPASLSNSIAVVFPTQVFGPAGWDWTGQHAAALHPRSCPPPSPVPSIESSTARWAHAAPTAPGSSEGWSIPVSLYSEHLSYVVITLSLSETTRCSAVLPVGRDQEEAGIPVRGPQSVLPAIHESPRQRVRVGGCPQCRPMACSSADLPLAGLYFCLKWDTCHS